MVAVLFIVFLVALAIGVPVAFSLGLASVAYMLGSHIQMINFAQYFFKGLDSFTLLCIPGFTFAGNLMNQGGISDKLLDFADALVGHVTGGLAYANVLASMVFAGISGTALSDTVALGGVEIPMMVNQGYDVPFSVAITAASSCLGPIIPPSVPMIMAATMTGLSVSKMFMAGIIPGLLMGLGLIVAALFVGRKANLTVQPKASGKERLKAFKDAFWGLLMPVIILGGIYGSIFTPTEAAAVSVFYGLIVGVFIYREINWKKMKDILIDSCSTTATVMFITMGATLFGYVLTRARLDLAIENFMLTVTNGNTVIFFIIVNVVLLIAGCFLDSTSALYIFTPLFAPVAVQLGIDPIHLGTVMIVNLAIGLFTPPVGVNLYVACGIGDIKIEEITKGIVPCLIAELAVLLLITYVPAISTFLIH